MGHQKHHGERGGRGLATPATEPRHCIKFKHGGLRELRSRLLEDSAREHFAVLLGKTEILPSGTIINVYDQRFLTSDDYQQQSIAFLRLKKEFVYRTLQELKQRYDIDTIVDVHTHPFCQAGVHFSGTDDADEQTFFRFLCDKFSNIHYASIVLSQSQYSARVWTHAHERVVGEPARIKTQTMPETITSADFTPTSAIDVQQQTLTESNGIFHRSTLALGLDVMRQITSEQTIAVVGVGGLGSVIAEHLIHMGFHHLHLIDPDVLEVSNLNRIVGAYYADAVEQMPKVAAVKHHLQKINPQAVIVAHQCDVNDQQVEQALALADWIIVATDNHTSRFRAQQLSLRYFVPLISVGVNITVANQKIQDMSGEVITARPGDRLCLNCLGRINPIQIAQESHNDQQIRTELVKRGYVAGTKVKEPAVKTLNTMLATLAVDTLINQYLERQRHVPVLVYEDNLSKTIYEDHESVARRNKHCFTCAV